MRFRENKTRPLPEAGLWEGSAFIQHTFRPSPIKVGWPVELSAICCPDATSAPEAGGAIN